MEFGGEICSALCSRPKVGTTLSCVMYCLLVSPVWLILGAPSWLTQLIPTLSSLTAHTPTTLKALLGVTSSINSSHSTSIQSFFLSAIIVLLGFCQIWYKLESFEEGIATEKMSPSDLSVGKVTVVFSWLMVDMGGPNPPHRCPWVVQESKLSKLWRASQ